VVSYCSSSGSSSSGGGGGGSGSGSGSLIDGCNVSLQFCQDRINHSGAHTNVGPFSHTRSQDFLWGCFSEGALLFSQKLTTFLVVVKFKPNLYGTTGTMVNPALSSAICIKNVDYKGR